MADERQAVALAHELAWAGRLDLQANGDGWDITIDCPRTHRMVVRVLEGVRRILAGEPAASALVLLDGREHRLRGE